MTILQSQNKTIGRKPAYILLHPFSNFLESISVSISMSISQSTIHIYIHMSMVRLCGVYAIRGLQPVAKVEATAAWTQQAPVRPPSVSQLDTKSIQNHGLLGSTIKGSGLSFYILGSRQRSSLCVFPLEAGLPSPDFLYVKHGYTPPS